ncbi:hypothetical protein [Salmonella phage SSBI34]|nr:hypothetical protein [Salmonella phage SSBI34]
MATNFVDFALDPLTGDLDFSGQSINLIESNQLSLRQRLYLRFAIWSGDWWFDETFGFPYRAFISKKTIKSVLDGRIKSEVRMEPDVMEISEFRSEMDVVNRTYQCFFTVVTQEGIEVNMAFMGQDGFEYPTPPEGNTSLCGDEGVVIQFKNKLYYLINFRLPSYGDATWVNNWK